MISHLSSFLLVVVLCTAASVSSAATPTETRPPELLRAALRSADTDALDAAARATLAALATAGGQPDWTPELSVEWSDDDLVSAFVLSRDDGRSILVMDVPRRYSLQQADDVAAALAHELVHVLSERIPTVATTNADWAVLLNVGLLPMVTRFNPAASDAFEASLSRHSVTDAADEAVADLLAISLSRDAFGAVHAARVRAALHRFRTPARTEPVVGLSGLSYAVAAEVLDSRVTVSTAPLPARFSAARGLVFPRLLAALANHPSIRAEVFDDGSRPFGFRANAPSIRPRGEDLVFLAAVRQSGHGFKELDGLLATHGGLLSVVRANGDSTFAAAVALTTSALRSVIASPQGDSLCTELALRARDLGQADFSPVAYACDRQKAADALRAISVFTVHRQATHNRLIARLTTRPPETRSAATAGSGFLNEK